MWQRHAVHACAIVAIFFVATARGDVGITQLTPDRLGEVSDRLRLAVGAVPGKPNLYGVSLSGPATEGVVVSVIVMSAGANGETRLRVPIQVTEAIQLLQGVKKKVWHSSCELDQELAEAATIDVLLDDTTRSIGQIYRIAVKDFLEAEKTREGAAK